MKFPVTEADLVLAGYAFRLRARCNGRTCKATIHWFQTPAGKRIPFSQIEGQAPGALLLLEPHFASCPDSKDFRRKA